MFKSLLLSLVLSCFLTFGLQAKITLSDDEINQLGKPEILEILEKNNYHPNSINNAGDTALHLAVKKNDLAAFKLILLYGLSPLIPNKALDTPLHLAAEKGNSVFVKLLIEKGAQINSTNALGQTPYHKALKNNHSEITDLFLSLGFVQGEENTDYLIALGYNPKTIDTAGNTALHKAAAGGDLQIVELLLQHGASINFESTPRYESRMTGNTKQYNVYFAPIVTPLAIAERMNPDNKVLLQLLKDKGAVSKAEDDYTDPSRFLDGYVPLVDCFK